MGDPGNIHEQLPPVKQALIELRALRSKVDAIHHRQHEPIAIVGAGLRFPGGAVDLDSFWKLLLAGFNGVREVPPDRWDIDALYDPDPDAPGKMYARYGGFLESVDGFDPLFFGISPREAASMDPQQRLLLEVGWEAIENAGESAEKLAGTATGLFLGIGNSDYLRMALSSPEKIDTYSVTGSALSIAPSRLAYVLNLKGPCMAVDTACSSSLVAVHLAVRSLRAGECNLALVGGVNLILTPELSINFCKARMLTAGAKCKTFDAGGDGYVRGEGCAVVVLKRLSDAVADGNHIVALIRGSAINQDGRTSGITAPNGPAQEAVIAEAMKDGGVKPLEVDYIEAHGTATPLGDPIEVQALGTVFGKGREADRPLAIGSVKTNFGHLEAAAGIAGLIKAALVLHHGIIPPHLHLEQLNPHISLDQYSFTIPTLPTPWPAGTKRRIAGVSSFGFSGTNAHVVLEAASDDRQITSQIVRPLHLLVLSAKNETSLGEMAGRFSTYLAQDDLPAFSDICFTANAGRSHLHHRIALVADSSARAREQLEVFCAQKSAENIFQGNLEDGFPEPRIAFLFTGQGSQYEGMGLRLFETQPDFRESLQHCEEVLRPHLKQPLLKALYPQPGAPSVLNQSLYTQVALFSLEYALVRLWRSWGIRPSVVMGHSLGEYAAACAAGIFSVEDGLQLIVQRARLIESVSRRGEMAAVFADPHRVADAVAPFARDVSIAALNGPEHTVISGSGEAIQAILSILERDHVACRKLNVSHAYHSPLLEPIIDSFTQAATSIHYAKPETALVSNLTGRPIQGEEINPDHWRRHLREPVRFSDSINTLIKQGYRIFLEIGPHPVLYAMAQSITEVRDLTWLFSLRRDVDDWTQLLESLASLYVRGAPVDWEGLDRGRSRRRVPLPTYPFQRQRYWIGNPSEKKVTTPPHSLQQWRFAVDAGHRQAQQGPLDLRPEVYGEKWQRLEEWTVALTARTLFRLGAFTRPNESLSLDEVLQRCSILPAYRHLLSRWLSRLADKGLLDATLDRFVSRRRLEGSLVEQHLEAAHRLFSDHRYFIAYLERCGTLLEDVITGRQPALETLFPDGSSQMAESLYGEFPVSRYIASISASVLAAIAGVQPTQDPFRVIEIGAGTGGTTGEVLRSLPPRQMEYWFTDISTFFFARAQVRFAPYSFVHYSPLDIEQSPLEQGFVPHAYQAVVMTNVLHATRNIDRAIDNVLALLAPGGFLILSEVTRDLAWYDVTTGLIEGWQRFEDAWRKDSPLLSPQQWKEVLRSRGFEEVEAMPEAGSVSEILGQHVIVARAPVKDHTSGTITAIGSKPTTAPARFDKVTEGIEKHPPKRSDEFLQKLKESPRKERYEVLIDCVQTQVAAVLRLDPSHIPSRRGRLLDLGLDSLMAVELRNRLGDVLGLQQKLPATLVFDYPTAEAIAGFLEGEFLDSSEGTKPEIKQMKEAITGKTTSAEKIARMSDEQVEQMLLERLKRKKETKE